MATHRKPILGMVLPDGTGECWVEPYSILATNDKWQHPVVRFGSSNAAQPTVRHGIYSSFTVPKNYVSAPKIVVVWSATVTSGNVVWGFEYRTVGGDNTTSLDQATSEEALTVTQAAPTTTNFRREVSLTAAANFSVDELVEFYFTREGANASDTAAGSGILHDLLFEYADV